MREVLRRFPGAEETLLAVADGPPGRTRRKWRAA